MEGRLISEIVRKVEDKYGHRIYAISQTIGLELRKEIEKSGGKIFIHDDNNQNAGNICPDVSLAAQSIFSEINGDILLAINYSLVFGKRFRYAKKIGKNKSI